MKRTLMLVIILAALTSCNNKGGKNQQNIQALPESVSTDEVLIASDIVTDVIIKPSPEGDPWEIEKVAGYKGGIMVNSVFNRIYDGSLVVFDYHTNEPMSANDVRDIEKEFNHDRSKIGKLSFTEDWYYNPATNKITKITKSVVFGFEIYNNEGRVYGYKAAFKADFGK